MATISRSDAARNKLLSLPFGERGLISMRNRAGLEQPAEIRKLLDDLSHPAFPPDIGGLLRQKAAAPIKPAKPQQPCDVGLFSDEADQLDLCEMFQDQPEDGL